MPADTKPQRTRRVAPEAAAPTPTPEAPAGSNTAVEAPPGPLPIDTPPRVELQPSSQVTWSRYRHPRTEVVSLPDDGSDTVTITRTALEVLLREAGFDRQAPA